MITDGESTNGSVPSPVKRARYLQPLEYYPAHFQSLLGLSDKPVSVRSLKGWIGDGRDASPPELPPFDEPARLKDWWTRIKKNRAPDWLVSLAALAARVVVQSAPAPPSLDVSPGPLFAAAASTPAAPSPPTSLSPSGVGYSGALQRLREAEAAAGNLYTTLLRQAAEPQRTAEDRSRLTAEAEQARRAWDDLVNRLRPMEKDAAEILAAAGSMWNADEVAASMGVVHIALKESILGLWRRARAKLRACPDPAEEDKIWREEVEKIFAALRANKFTRPADVDVPAATA